MIATLKTAPARFSSFWVSATAALVIAAVASGGNHQSLPPITIDLPPVWRAADLLLSSLGTKVTQTDARAKQTKLAYDNGNRLTRRTLPAGSESFGYDAAGNLTTRTDALNRATSFKYDDANREIEKMNRPGFRRRLSAIR